MKDLKQNPNLENISPHALVPYTNNARTHSDKQVTQIANSIKRFGFLNPVLIDHDNNIMAGHGRVKAAQNLGLDKVPVRRVSHLSDDEKRAYILADNKLAEKAGWDRDILKIELEHLLMVNDDISIDVTGLEMPEIDMIILGQANDHSKADDEFLPVVEEMTVSQDGDLWILGNHKIYCGNALDENAYQTLMGDDRAQMVFTDPPYNVPIDGHVCGNGSTRHDEFAMASGEMTSEEFTAFLKSSFQNLAKFSESGALHYLCMDWRHIRELQRAGDAVYTEVKNLCVWNKNNGGMGSLYRSKHELVFVYKHGEAAHINNIELGKNGRYRTNVWDYAGVSGKPGLLKMHPTVKPADMIADAMLDCTRHGDIVLDCFGGSGSTIIAAQRVHRHARLIELDPKYVDVTIRRWQEETGEQAVHAVSGHTFNDSIGGRL